MDFIIPLESASQRSCISSGASRGTGRIWSIVVGGSVKSMSREKTERNKAIREYRLNNPHISLNRLAQQYGVSRVRVYPIVGKRHRQSWWRRISKRIKR